MAQGNQAGLPSGGGTGNPAPAQPAPQNDQATTPNMGGAPVPNPYDRASAGPAGRKK